MKKPLAEAYKRIEFTLLAIIEKVFPLTNLKVFKTTVYEIHKCTKRVFD